jgi:hypothetical protein
MVPDTIVGLVGAGQAVGFTACMRQLEQRIGGSLLQLLCLRGSNEHGAHWKTQKQWIRIVSPIVNREGITLVWHRQKPQNREVLGLTPPSLSGQKQPKIDNVFNDDMSDMVQGV